MRHLTAVAALGLVCAACEDPASAPVPLQTGPRLSVAAAHDTLYANGRKYRDAGFHPATGRSGTATLNTRALLGKDGTTTLDVSAAPIDTQGLSSGSLAKTQVKAFDTKGKLEWTRNYNGLSGGPSATWSFTGLVRGNGMQVQANIRGVDGSRTDVVTVRDIVRLRPNLNLSRDPLSVPPRVNAGMPVNISAVVRETNGDVGARADCLLSVDGTPADYAYQIWVDAGGVVSCIFTRVFSDVSTHHLEVRAANVTPGDYDTSDNSVSADITVVQAPLNYFAQVNDVSSTYSDFNSSRWQSADGNTGNEWASQYDNATHSQSAYLIANGARALAFPLVDVELSQATGGQQVHVWSTATLNADYEYGPPENHFAQVSRMVDGASFSLYTYRFTSGGSTYVQSYLDYRRDAGDVTYRSSGFSHFWDFANGTDSYYSYNYAFDSSWGSLVPFGSDYSMSVRFTSGGESFRISPVIALAPFSYSYGYPLTCSDYSYADITYHNCYSSSSSSSGSSGYAFGASE